MMQSLLASRVHMLAPAQTQGLERLKVLPPTCRPQSPSQVQAHGCPTTNPDPGAWSVPTCLHACMHGWMIVYMRAIYHPRSCANSAQVCAMKCQRRMNRWLESDDSITTANESESIERINADFHNSVVTHVSKRCARQGCAHRRLR